MCFLIRFRFHLFFCLTGCQRELTECVVHTFRDPALEESVYVRTLLFLFFPLHSEDSTCITNINACLHKRRHTQHRELRTNTQPQREVPMLKWLCEAKVTQSHDFIPIVPCVGWVRGLIMAGTLQKETTALTQTLETLTAHHPA